MKILTVLMLAATLAGCASDKDYTAYLQAQQEANRQAAADQKPLVRLTAQPGQQITGLQSLEVYTPSAAPVIQQARPNEWVGVVQTAVGVTGTVLGIRAAGQAAVGIADSVGRAGTAGYGHIQAPTTTTTTTTTIAGTGVVGGGTVNTVGGTGAAGGNYADQHSPVDSSNQGNADNSNQNNGNPDNSNQGNGNPVTGNPAPAATGQP